KLSTVMGPHVRVVAVTTTRRAPKMAPTNTARRATPIDSPTPQGTGTRGGDPTAGPSPVGAGGMGGGGGSGPAGNGSDPGIGGSGRGSGGGSGGAPFTDGPS